MVVIISSVFDVGVADDDEINVSCCCSGDDDSTVISPTRGDDDSSLLTDAGVVDEGGGRFGLKGVDDDEGNGVIAMLLAEADNNSSFIGGFDEVFGRFDAAFEK